MKYPYQNNGGLKNYNQITIEEINYLIKQPCLFGRKFNPGCIVVQSNSTLPNGLVESLLEYLTKQICE